MGKIIKLYGNEKPEEYHENVEHWTEREERRMRDGTYKPLPKWLTDMPFWQHSRLPRIQFPHFSHTEKGAIAFTQSPQEGQADKQVYFKVADYLDRYFGYSTSFDLKNRIIKRLEAEQIKEDRELKIAQDIIILKKMIGEQIWGLFPEHDFFVLLTAIKAAADKTPKGDFERPNLFIQHGVLQAINKKLSEGEQLFVAPSTEIL